MSLLFGFVSHSHRPRGEGDSGCLPSVDSVIRNFESRCVYLYVQTVSKEAASIMKPPKNNGPLKSCRPRIDAPSHHLLKQTNTHKSLQSSIKQTNRGSRSTTGSSVWGDRFVSTGDSRCAGGSVCCKFSAIAGGSRSTTGGSVCRFTTWDSVRSRYALDVNIERAQEVLMHKKLLHMAHDPKTRPAFEARLIQLQPIVDENGVDSTSSYTRLMYANTKGVNFIVGIHYQLVVFKRTITPIRNLCNSLVEAIMREAIIPQKTADAHQKPITTVTILQPIVDENGVDSTSSYTRLKDAQISIHPGRQRHDFKY
ncbi:serine-threonine/tyrosine-protein kinase catalytic domain-containing protein [Artemisia annua]|uniref:Serine-threonine/tyrosine-protein kinase catalytic domain-containing protein n=1 Tax=Artemisia annua TaxID=35608 RepID=A0A2U1M3I7_ARTAN|nr:serine-threonine/tyrosine-protein kinase catalytic domain-containing protein [Artemisia annua]